ncbi:MAG TPA: CDGSH iron-sulfur domain-containing protein [Terriglobales bacterium]|nr:CDGSH iron-sulfur domain-containing protein [Terriglobales bacterium]
MPDVTITIRRNGSLKVEGPIRLIDSAGQEMTLPADKPVISLCRCGHSQNKPFCDGSHKAAQFDGAEAHIRAAEAAAASGTNP